MEHNALANREARPINTWLESLNSLRNSANDAPEYQREVEAQKDDAILVLLAKLALVYWRPDFTPQQAKQLYSQYLDDLRPFAFKDVAWAVEKYRQDPESKFYPTPGQLRGVLSTPYSWDPNPRNHMAERLADGRAEMQQMIAASPGYRAMLASSAKQKQIGAPNYNSPEAA